MIEVLMLAAGVVAGLDIRRALLLGGAVYAPLPLLALTAFAGWRQRGRRSAPAVGFCDAVASELRSGVSLRVAIASAARSAGATELENAAVGTSSVDELAVAARGAFPQVGAELMLTIPAVARSGSGGADLFDEIGTLALVQQEVAREVRVASAPARATAAVFLLAPTAYLVVQARTGGLSRLLESGGQGVVAGAGLAMLMVGLVTAGLIMWRAR